MQDMSLFILQWWHMYWFGSQESNNWVALQFPEQVTLENVLTTVCKIDHEDLCEGLTLIGEAGTLILAPLLQLMLSMNVAC